MSALAGDRPMSRGRRLYRAVVFALIVGVVGAGLSVIPGLFVQAIFIGNAQRCEAQQEIDVAITGKIETECAENLATTPKWLPPTIIAGGGVLGLLGGFGYGLAGPRTAPKREQLWLPF